MSFVDLLTPTVWISTVIIILLSLIYQWWKKPHPNFPPLIRGIPGFGVLPYLDAYPQKLFKQWSLKMNEPVISVRIGSTDTVVLNTYEVANEALVKQSYKTAGKPNVFIYNQVAKNNGVGFRDLDETFKKIKYVITRFFKTGFGSGVQTTVAIENLINEQANHYIDELKKIGDTPVDIRAQTSRLTINILSMVIANKHYDYDDPTMENALENIKYLMSESEDAEKLVQLNVFPRLRFFPSYHKANEKAKRCMGLLIKNFIDPLIEEHKETFNPDDIKDLIDAFFYEQQFGIGKDDKEFNIEQLRQGARDMFMAGTDTSAASVSWLVLCLLYFPEHKNMLMKEIDDVLGRDGIPSLSLKAKMPFTFAFMQEVARFRSSANMTYRKTKQEIKVAGYTIPEETPILVNFLGVHKDPKTWEDPEEFDPHRHIDENGEFVLSSKIMAFGVGYRSCIGETIARRQVFIVFMKLLQKFEISSDLEKLPSLDKGYNNLAHCPLPYKVVLTPR